MKQILEIFGSLGATERNLCFFDFQHLTWRNQAIASSSPTSVDHLCEIVGRASERAIPIRTRAFGHSMNGSSSPTAAELLIDTRGLSEVCFGENDALIAASGANLWAIQSLLNTNGRMLPVVNDGMPGPSVGGFISSGGFGSGSMEHGGFGENVIEIKVVQANGAIQVLTPNDPEFKWHFGAMGQLGVVATARLKTVPLGTKAATPLEVGREYSSREMQNIHLNLIESVRASLEKQTGSSDINALKYFGASLSLDKSSTIGTPVAKESPLFWFTLFASGAQLEHAVSQLDTLEAGWRRLLHFEERYKYLIQYKTLSPPLIYPVEDSMYAVGSWWTFLPSTPLSSTVLQSFEEAFMRLTMSGGYYRYIQSELPSSPPIYRKYFGESTYAAFLDVKLKKDPICLFNRGSVFPV